METIKTVHLTGLFFHESRSALNATSHFNLNFSMLWLDSFLGIWLDFFFYVTVGTVYKNIFYIKNNNIILLFLGNI